jgi:eukaryotic-like serine/threonine-protein kinase
VQPSAAASRVPVYAGIAAVLVVAAGVGGWFLYSDATRALPHATATPVVAGPGAAGSDEAPRGESREPIRPREEVLAPFKAILAPVECGATVEAEMNAEGHYRIRFTGTMRTDATFWERVAQLTANTSIAGLDNQMKSVPPSYCDAIRLVDVAGGAPGETPAIAADRPDLVYKDGEFLVLKVKVPQRVAGYLYVDGLDQDGNVVHLFPTPLRKSNAVKPGDEVQVGATPDKAGPREDVFEMTPPYGTQLVLAIASQKPLFASSRQQIENASDYLSVLRAAMDKTADSPAAATVASYRFLDIVPK